MKLAIVCGQKSEDIKKRLLSIHDNLQIDAYVSIDSMIKNSIQRQYFYDRIIFASHLIRGKELDSFYTLKDYVINDSPKSEVIYVCSAKDTDSAKDFDELFSTPNYSSYLSDRVTLETLKNAAIMRVEAIFKKFSYLKERPAESEVEYYDIEEEGTQSEEDEEEKEEKPVKQPKAKKEKKGLFGGLLKGKKKESEQVQQESQAGDDLASQDDYPDDTNWEDAYYDQASTEDGYEDDGYYEDEDGNYDTNYDESSQIAESWDDGVYSEENGDYADYPETDEEQTYVPNASTAEDYDDTYGNEDYPENYQNSQYVEDGEDEVYGEDAPYDESGDEVYGDDAPYDTEEEPYPEDDGYAEDDNHYLEQEYPKEDYPSDEQYPEEPYPDEEGYPVDESYPEDDQYNESYPEDGQYDESYPEDEQYDESYSKEGYPDEDQYPDGDYPDKEDYPDENGYPDESYPVDDYPNDDTYPEDEQYPEGEDDYPYDTPEDEQYNHQDYDTQEYSESDDQYPEEHHEEIQGIEEPDTSAMVADDDDDWSIPEKKEPEQDMNLGRKGTLASKLRGGDSNKPAAPRGFRNAPQPQEDLRPRQSRRVEPEPEVEDDVDDDFSSLSVDENAVDAYRNDTTNVIVKEKVVVKHIPIDGAKGGLFAGLVNGTSKRTFVVTGDRGTGVTSLAWEMAKFLSQNIPVLYFDCDIRTHGLLSYVEYNEISKFGNAQLQGTKFCKNTNSFYNCVIPYADNLDIITSNYGTHTTKDELAVTAQVIAEKSLDYGAVIIDAPFDILPTIEDLLVSSTILFCVTATKVGFMNAVCVLEDNELSQRYLRQMFTKGKMVFTKKNKRLKVDALKKYINDIVELEDINWLEMNAVVLGEKVDSNFVAALLD